MLETPLKINSLLQRRYSLRIMFDLSQWLLRYTALFKESQYQHIKASQVEDAAEISESDELGPLMKLAWKRKSDTLLCFNDTDEKFCIYMVCHALYHCVKEY